MWKPLYHVMNLLTIFFFILLYSTTVIESLYDVITVESVNKIALNTQIFYQFKRLMDGSVIL